VESWQEKNLAGTVGSAAEKRQAYWDAWVAGVESVRNDGLEVKYWARDERLRKKKYVVRPDDEIKKAVEEAYEGGASWVRNKIAVE